jgi:hypothetical protein
MVISDEQDYELILFQLIFRVPLISTMFVSITGSQSL